MPDNALSDAPTADFIFNPTNGESRWCQDVMDEKADNQYYFQSRFMLQNRELFGNNENPDRFFTPAQRIELTYILLCGGLYDESMRIGYLRDDSVGVYIDSFALHDGMLPPKQKKATATQPPPPHAPLDGGEDGSGDGRAAGIGSSSGGGGGASESYDGSSGDAAVLVPQNPGAAAAAPAAATFPLVAPDECKLRTRASLLRRWGRLRTIFKAQPHDAIVRYFGSKAGRNQFIGFRRECSRTLMGYSDPITTFPRGGSLLPSIFADARYIDDVIAL